MILSLIHENINNEFSDSSVILLCVLRNEMIMLDYFLSYYSDIGVTHFIFVDNGSTDGFIEYMKTKTKLNYMIYYTEDSYKDNNYGVDWINHLLNIHCISKWCIVVDIDELLLIKEKTINELIQKMEMNKSNITFTFLLDMYPKRISNRYKRGQNFLMHSYYYDKVNTDVYDYSSYEGDKRNGFYNAYIHGGVRKRLYNLDCCISKRSFFFYDFHESHNLNAGYHIMIHHNTEINNKLNYYNEAIVLLHFKYVKPQLKEIIKTRIKNNQDWDNSAEYKQYLKLYKYNIHNSKYSKKYIDKKDLYNEISKVIDYHILEKR